MRATAPSVTSAINEQPTPQYAQVVATVVWGRPAVSTLFSMSAPVGHASTQAPHETHSDSRNDAACEADTRESSPRPSIVSANVPCVCSQARTQREQTMHRSLSNRKYGLLWSGGAGVACARAAWPLA